MSDRTPFHDLAKFVALPRLDRVRLAPDGSWLVAAVATLDPEGKRFTPSLWRIDAAGEHPAQRLTRSAKGESSAAFLPDGDVLFLSARPDPNVKDSKDDAALWRLPAGGGEASVVSSRPGGYRSVTTAKRANTVVLGAHLLGDDVSRDAELRKQRDDLGVTAILHEEALVRYWDHDLGPGIDHRLVTTAPDNDATMPDPTDLTSRPGRGLQESSEALTPDGSTLVVSWCVPDGRGGMRYELRAIDVATGAMRTLAASERHSFEGPVVSPDGTLVVCARETQPTYDEADEVVLWAVGLDGEGGRVIAEGWDHRPTEVAWTPDAGALIVATDEQGRGPIFRIDLASGAITRLTRAGYHGSIQVAPDGAAVYAVRSAIDRPPHVVRYDAAAADQDATVLPGPLDDIALPGTLTEVSTTASDGTPLRAWLALPAEPAGGAPAPLLVFVHGGPLGSWNGWHWRWCPWMAVARGYAVLMPDPAFSTGYGQRMVERGWGQWGGAPYDDVMALVDATVARDDIDAARTGLLGGSYGGYMANWVAGHTDRFRCIVTHASLWSLDQFAQTTDVPGFWRDTWGDARVRPERYEAWSPDRFADAITTPMLVIHGDKDYRVPIGEALRLWDDLTRRGVNARFLYFPSEGHWVLSPGNARVWHETVLAFCDEHVLGRAWTRPSLL